MQHVHALEEIKHTNAWLTVGVFDGVHTGHQGVIRHLVAGARAAGSPAVVLTFDPHPMKVLRPEAAPLMLTDPAERARRLGDLGVDTVITLPFDKETADFSAEDFVALLVKHLGLSVFWVGPDFALGKKRSGDIRALRLLGEQHGYRLEVFSQVRFEEKRVSSSWVRQALQTGEIRLANRLLGYPYTLEAKIVPGDQRGRTIGIPTANMNVSPDKLIPMGGVYACQATVVEDDRLVGSWQAVTNIGVRPTFDGHSARLSVETHLLDFDQVLYDKQLRLEFVERLRDEQRFSGVEALVAQIHQDIQKARTLLEPGNIQE